MDMLLALLVVELEMVRCPESIRYSVVSPSVLFVSAITQKQGIGITSYLSVE